MPPLSKAINSSCLDMDFFSLVNFLFSLALAINMTVIAAVYMLGGENRDV